MSVVVVFSICFLPCTIARAVLLYFRLQKMQAEEDVAVQVYDALMVLSYADCLLDPLVYCFCNSGFKDAYITAFCPGPLQVKLLNANFGLGSGATTITTNSAAKTVTLPIMEKS